MQRAPAQAVVWGHTSAGASVNTTFDGQTYTARADGNGTWRQKLPATAANDKNYTLSFVGSAGEHASMSGVLFGGERLLFSSSDCSFEEGQRSNGLLMSTCCCSAAEIRSCLAEQTIMSFASGKINKNTIKTLRGVSSVKC